MKEFSIYDLGETAFDAYWPNPEVAWLDNSLENRIMWVAMASVVQGLVHSTDVDTAEMAFTLYWDLAQPLNPPKWGDVMPEDIAAWERVVEAVTPAEDPRIGIAEMLAAPEEDIYNDMGPGFQNDLSVALSRDGDDELEAYLANMPVATVRRHIHELLKRR